MFHVLKSAPVLQERMGSRCVVGKYHIQVLIKTHTSCRRPAPAGNRLLEGQRHAEHPGVQGRMSADARDNSDRSCSWRAHLAWAVGRNVVAGARKTIQFGADRSTPYDSESSSPNQLARVPQLPHWQQLPRPAGSNFFGLSSTQNTRAYYTAERSCR